MTTNQDKDRARAELAASLAAFAFRQSQGAILKPKRGKAETAMARQVAMYSVYVGFGLSLARVAAAFNRDRSTVAHACRRIEDRRDDGLFDAWLASFEDTLVQADALGTDEQVVQ
ncbi:MAG: helix-turn-helix domain-containing protein [Pseudomonadota bacterium]